MEDRLIGECFSHGDQSELKIEGGGDVCIWNCVIRKVLL